MSFLGSVLKPNKKEKINVPESEIWHLSQICLHDPKPGKNYVQVEVKGQTFTMCCLEKDKVEHNAVDLFFGPDAATFVNKGTSDVHLLGYLEPMEPSSADEDDDDEEEGEEEEKKPADTKAAAKAAASPKAAPKAEPKAAASPKAAAKAEPKAAASPKAAAKAEPKAKAKAEEEEDDEDDEEGEEEEEGEESEEEAAPAAKKAEPKAEPKAGAKRAAEEPKKAEASPAKKAKGDDAKAATPKAEAKPAAGGDDEAKYVKSLQEFLKTAGKSNLSKIGGAVSRPAGVPKMKAVLTKHKDKFVIEGENVSLK